jgi:hypothetical protein
MLNHKGRKKVIPVSQQEKILNALHTGSRTWDDIKRLTNIKDDRLGLTLGELLDLRKIWTAQRDGVRVYGIEGKPRLPPRFTHP